MLPKVTKETADSLAKIATDNPKYHIEVLQKLEETNPVLYQYLDFTLALLNRKFSPELAAEAGSVIGMTVGLLESQSEADEMAKQFQMDDESDLE